MVDWPLVGRFVRMATSVVRLPEFRAEYLDLAHRLHVSESDTQNLVKSVPVAVRKITRDLIEIRNSLESSSSSLDQQLNDVRGQLESLSGSVGYLLGRVEFVRREMMFEMRYGSKAPISTAERVKVKAEIIDSQKLAVARNERLCLNLGCGHVPLEGYLNVDRRALPRVDIVAEVDELPFEKGEVNNIFSAHLLEHFPQEELRRKLLPYWVSLLKSGGTLSAVVPDAEAMIKGYIDGTYPYSSLREVTFGAQDYDGDFHFNMFVTDQMEDLLKEAGLQQIEWTARGRRNGACYEMEFRALKK